MNGEENPLFGIELHTVFLSELRKHCTMMLTCYKVYCTYLLSSSYIYVAMSL